MNNTIDIEFDSNGNMVESWKIFCELGHERFINKGVLLYSQDEPADCFFVVVKGKVRLFISSHGGTEKTLAVCTDGTVFGQAAFFDGMTRMSSAETLETSTIVSVNKELLLRAFAVEPGLAFTMIGALSRRVRMLSAQVDSISFLSAEKRVAIILISMCDESDTVHCTHDELADAAGTSRVTVSKILKGFSQRCWIGTAYREIYIKKREELSKFANNY